MNNCAMISADTADNNDTANNNGLLDMKELIWLYLNASETTQNKVDELLSIYAESPNQ